MNGQRHIWMLALVWGMVSGTGRGDDISSPPQEIELTDCRIKLTDQVTLSIDRTGILRFVEPREGGVVRARQKVAGLQVDMIQAELDVAEHRATNDIEVRAHEKARELAVFEYDRARVANRDVKNTVPLIEFQRFKLAAEKASLDVDLANHELTLARLQRDFKQSELAAHELTAPFGGVVTKVYRQRGEAVRQGDPILELTNTDRVRVEGWLSLDHAWRVSIGNHVSVRLDIPDADLPVEEQVFEGRITFIDLSVQPVTHQTKIFAEVVNHQNILKAGLTAVMAVQLDSSEKQALSAHSQGAGKLPREKLKPTARFDRTPAGKLSPPSDSRPK